MRNIINLILKAVVIMGAAYLFPNNVVCRDVGTLVMAIICIVVTGFTMELITYGIAVLMVIIDKKILAFLASIALTVISGFIQLDIACTLVDGFEIYGMLTYTILIIAMSILSVKESEKS